MVGLYSSEALFEVGKNIVDVLRADGKADGRRRDALIEQLFLGELCVRRGRRMDDEGLHVRDVCKQRENFEVINEAERGFLPALDLEGEDARFFRNSTTFFVFSACRSRRRDSVSVPCRSKNAANGEMAAPWSRSKIART